MSKEDTETQGDNMDFQTGTLWDLSEWTTE